MKKQIGSAFLKITCIEMDIWDYTQMFDPNVFSYVLSYFQYMIILRAILFKETFLHWNSSKLTNKDWESSQVICHLNQNSTFYLKIILSTSDHHRIQRPVLSAYRQEGFDNFKANLDVICSL